MLNKLQHDDQGFLVGAGQVKPSREESFLLRQIADDVRAIRQAMRAKLTQRERQDRGLDDAPTPGSKRSSNVVALPVRSDRAAARASTVGGAKPTGSRIADAVGSTRVVTPNRATGDGIRRLSDAIAQRLPRAGSTTSTGLVNAVATPRVRDERGRFLPAEKASKDAARAARSGKLTAEAGEVGQRDGKGRFTSSGGDDGDSRLLKTVEGLGDKIGNLAIGNNEASEIDPTVKAAADVAGLAARSAKGVIGVSMQIAKPLGRGMSRLFGGKASDAPTPWFRRFFSEMRLLRREQSVYNKAEMRVLKEIERKPVAETGRAGMFGLMGGLLAGLASGLLKKVLGGLGAVGSMLGLSRLASGRGGRAGLPTTAAPAGGQAVQRPGVFARMAEKFKGGAAVPGAAAPDAPGGSSRLGKLGAGLKRIPVLGTLLALGMGAGAVHASESDKSLTREQKDRKSGKAVGGVAGGLSGAVAGAAGGAAIGTLVFPGVGTAIGGAIGAVAGGFFGDKAGSILGDVFGGWVSDLRKADIPGVIGRGWASFTGGLSGLLGKMGINVPDLQKKVADVTTSVKKGYSDATGQPVKLSDREAARAREKAASVDTRRTDAPTTPATPPAPTTIERVAEGAGRVAGTAAQVATDAGKWAGGKAKGAANAVKLASHAMSAGITNPKELAAFMGQMEHESAGFTQMTEGKYSADRVWALRGKTLAKQGETLESLKAKEAVGGSNAMYEAMYGGRKDLGNTEVGDGARFKGRGFTQLTGRANYADMSKKLGIDLVANPDMAADPEIAAKIATQFWQDKKIGAAAQAGDTSRVTKLINGGQIGLEDRVAKTAKWEQKIAQGGMPGAAGAQAATVQPPALQTGVPVVTASTTQSVKAAPVTSLPAIPEAPSPDQHASSATRTDSGSKPVVVAVDKGRNVGRDLADRKIAHIVTGGIAA